jgi:hypothetical protein
VKEVDFLAGEAGYKGDVVTLLNIAKIFEALWRD